MTAVLSPTDSDLQKWRRLVATLSTLSQQHPDLVFASSLAAEDMVITHAIATAELPIDIITLDTGKLPAQTVAMLSRVTQRYGVTVKVLRPEEDAVRTYVAEHGEFAFYESIALRKACCAIRKVEPLRRALAGRSAWLTGQHRDQSDARALLQESEHDAVFGLRKYNPLASWNHSHIWAVIRAFDIPYNPLHDQGYPSIGCEPCTRAVRPAEHRRAGRWWWEQTDSRECGLHQNNVAVAKTKVERNG